MGRPLGFPRLASTPLSLGETIPDFLLGKQLSSPSGVERGAAPAGGGALPASDRGAPTTVVKPRGCEEIMWRWGWKHFCRTGEEPHFPVDTGPWTSGACR